MNDLHPDKLAEGFFAYLMVGTIPGGELIKFPHVLREELNNPLRQTLDLFRKDYEVNGAFDAERVHDQLNGSDNELKGLLSDILTKDYPPAEEILTAIRRIRTAALEDVEVLKLGSLLSSDMPDEETYLDGLLAAGWVLVVGGLVKTRKTWLLLQMALHLATGIPFLGHNVARKYRVLYVGGEGSLRTIRERLRLAVAFVPGLQDVDLDSIGIAASCGRIKLDTPAGEKWLQRVSEEYDITIIDPLYRFVSRGSENDHADQRVIQDVFDRLKASGKALVVAHHLRKPQGVDAGAAELRGAGLDAFADSVLLLSRKRGAAGERFGLKYVLRHDEEPEDKILVPNGPLLAVAEEANLVGTSHVVRALEEAGGRVDGRAALVALVKKISGAGEQTVVNAIVRAESEGTIFSARREGRGRAKSYALAGAAA